METITAVLFVIGVFAVLVTWIASYVLIANDKTAGPDSTTVAPDQPVSSNVRELVSAHSD